MSDYQSNRTRSRGLLSVATDHHDDPSPDTSDCPPVSTEGRILEGAIDELLTRVRDTTAFSTSLQFDAWEPLEDRDQIRTVLEFVREAVHNAVANGGGTHIVVSLARRDRQCEIRISDDGRTGGRVADRGTMDRSARLLGGSFEVSHRLTGGTVMRLSFRT